MCVCVCCCWGWGGVTPQQATQRRIRTRILAIPHRTHSGDPAVTPPPVRCLSTFFTPQACVPPSPPPKSGRGPRGGPSSLPPSLPLSSPGVHGGVRGGPHQRHRPVPGGALHQPLQGQRPRRAHPGFTRPPAPPSRSPQAANPPSLSLPLLLRLHGPSLLSSPASSCFLSGVLNQ